MIAILYAGDNLRQHRYQIHLIFSHLEGLFVCLFCWFTSKVNSYEGTVFIFSGNIVSARGIYTQKGVDEAPTSEYHRHVHQIPVLIASASGKGSGKSAHMGRLTRDFATHIYDVWLFCLFI